MGIEDNKTQSSTVKNKIGAKEILEKLDEILKKDVVQKVQVVSKLGKFFKVKLARISSTTNQTGFKESATPDKEFTNPLDQDVTIEQITVLPSANFRDKGRLVIINDESIVFEDEAVQDWTDIGSLKIPLDKRAKILKRDKSLKFFIWNETDTTSISLTVTTTFADKVDDL